MFGVDLASVDDPGQPNWSAAQALGMGFVYLRSNYGIWQDPFYVSQKTKIPVLNGPYLFLRFPTKTIQVDSPEAQAQAMIATCGIWSGLPPCIDLEFPGNGISDTGMTELQALQWFMRAWQALKDHYGISPVIYSSRRVWIEDLGNPGAPELVDSPLWLAHYVFNTGTQYNLSPSCSPPPVPKPWGDPDAWWFHQYFGDSIGWKGHGVFNSTVDLSRFNNLVIGAQGTRVRWVQKRLKISQDGMFGPQTLKAIQDYQTSQRLPATGLVDLETFTKLAWMRV